MSKSDSCDRHTAGHIVRFDERRIDAIFAELDQCRLPGAAVGIAVAGRPVYRKGFGLASMELPVALSPTMRMRIGSTSKHFACFALLLLCEEGKANVDDAVGKFLPELHATVRDVSLRQLMNNTSGLRDVHDICWLFSGRGLPVSSEALLELYRDTWDVNARPGESWIYCNGGFLLVSSVIERITGQSLEEVLQERVFTPIGMHDSLLRRWDSDFVPNSATLHMSSPLTGFDRAYMGTALAGEGGIVSTVDDMLRWLAHMDQPVVGAQRTWELMKKPARLANGTSTGYGCGLITSDYRGVQTLHHSGGVLGGNAHMLKVPGAGLDVVVIVNRHDVPAMQLAYHVVDACLRDFEPGPAAHNGPFARGVYRSPSTGRVVQLFARNSKQIASVDGMEMPIEPHEQRVFVPSGIWSYHKLTFSFIGAQDSPEAVRLTHFGNIDELVPVAAYSAESQRRIVGEYQAARVGVRLVVSQSGERLLLLSHGRFGSVGYALDPIAEDLWRLVPANPDVRAGLISLDANSTVLRFRSDRLWGLPFERLT